MKRIIYSYIIALRQRLLTERGEAVNKQDILHKIKGGLIVSCQALEDEPLHSSYIMSRMAYATMLGGAVGIRANGVADIRQIKETVDLPIIGLIKKVYENSEIYITPTLKEIDELVSVGCDIIATDATRRLRPRGVTLELFFKEIRSKYPNQLFMADCSTIEEGIKAANLGFDIIGTTMSGYTPYTADVVLPNYHMMGELAKKVDVPIIAEGGIWMPEEMKKAIEQGVYSVVVGTAITRPKEITQRYVRVLQGIRK